MNHVEEIRRKKPTIDEIRAIPQTVREVPCGSTGVHESCLRSWNILKVVKALLDKGVPGSIVRWLIAEMEAQPPETQND